MLIGGRNVILVLFVEAEILMSEKEKDKFDFGS